MLLEGLGDGYLGTLPREGVMVNDGLLACEVYPIRSLTFATKPELLKPWSFGSNTE